MSVADAGPSARPGADELRASLRRLAREAAGFAAGKLDAWQQQTEGRARAAGPADHAAVAAIEAAATGRADPKAAALRAGWAAADVRTRTALVATLVLLVLTAPLLLLVVALLALLLKRFGRALVR